MALFHYGSSTPPEAALPHIALGRLDRDPRLGSEAIRLLVHSRCPTCGERPVSPRYAMCSRCRRSRAELQDRVIQAAREVRRILQAQRDYARGLVSQAVKEGIIVRRTWCEACGEEPDDPSTIEGHHEDYDAPLSLTWLCKLCHGQRHSVMAIEEGRSLSLEVQARTVELYGEEVTEIVRKW